MCGLVGLISRRPMGFYGGDLDIMEDMLLVDQLRGKDSTGAFSVYKNKQSEIIKIASHPSHLFLTKAWGEFRQRSIQRAKLCIGHNRKATVGKIKTENAHPFVEDNIILVHNGSLWDQGKSLTKKDVEVDSNAIAHALSGGADPKEVIPTIKGAFALIWYDTVTEKLYAVRNEDRPLHLITTDDNYVLSSEPLIAAIALERRNSKIKDMVSIAPGDLYEFGEKGEHSVSKVDVSKKAYRSTTTTTSHGTGRTHSGGTNYSRSTRESVNDYGNWEDMYSDCLEGDCGTEDTAPFVTGSTDNPNNRIKNLRDKLTEQAQKKFGETKGTNHSNVCALTQRTGGATRSDGTTANGLTQVETISEKDRSADNNTKMIQIDHPTLKRNQKVIFKVREIFKAGHEWRFRGQIAQPGEQLLDCVGRCPETWTAEKIGMEFVGKYAVGYVYFVTQTTGGLSVYIRNMDKPHLTQVHNNKVPMMMWQHALSFCTCIKCGSKIKAWEKNYTSVSAVSIIEKGGGSTRNVVKAMCADCIEQVIPEDEREEFKQGRARINESIQQGQASKDRKEAANSGSADAVQDRQPVSPESGTGNGSKVVVQGPATLQ